MTLGAPSAWVYIVFTEFTEVLCMQKSNWSEQSWWRKALDITLTALMVLGFLAFRLSPDMEGDDGLVLGCGAAGLILLLNWQRSDLSQRLRKFFQSK
jgi:hypothetical protein